MKLLDKLIKSMTYKDVCFANAFDKVPHQRLLIKLENHETKG